MQTLRQVQQLRDGHHDNQSSLFIPDVPGLIDTSDRGVTTVSIVTASLSTPGVTLCTEASHQVSFWQVVKRRKADIFPGAGPVAVAPRTMQRSRNTDEPDSISITLINSPQQFVDAVDCIEVG